MQTSLKGHKAYLLSEKNFKPECHALCKPPKLRQGKATLLNDNLKPFHACKHLPLCSSRRCIAMHFDCKTDGKNMEQCGFNTFPFKKTWSSSNLAPEIATAARLKTDLNTKIPSGKNQSWHIMAYHIAYHGNGTNPPN